MSAHERINDRTQAQSDSDQLALYEGDIVHIAPLADAMKSVETFAEETLTLCDNDSDSPEALEILARDLHTSMLLTRSSLQLTVYQLTDNPSELADVLAGTAIDISATVQQCLPQVFPSCTSCADLLLDPVAVRQYITDAMLDDPYLSSAPEQLITPFDEYLSSVAHHIFDHLARE